MDSLAQHYKARYHEALDHSRDGRKDVALDICWELRLKPNLGVYRRALVNLLIATLVEYEQVKYAEECLDLIDLIRQEQGELSDNIQRIEQTAKAFIERLEREGRGVDIVPTTAAVDAVSGLLSDPMDVEESTSNAKIEEPEDAAGENKVVYTYQSSFRATTAPDQVEGILRDSYHQPRAKHSNESTVLPVLKKGAAVEEADLLATPHPSSDA